MQDNFNQFEKRKQDHLKLALLPANQASELNIFDQVILQHEALPDLNFNDLSITSARFGKSVNTPFMVSSMTAGHEKAKAINYTLLAACAKSGWAMGVGSQRRELFDNEAAQEWHSLRHEFPNVSLFSNLGIAQLLEVSLAQIEQLTDVLNADGLIIHCNPLQEVIQPEGTPFFKGCWQKLETLIKRFQLPVIIKETGCGFSASTLQRLNDIGVAAVDVSGLGGTHWGRIEGCRSQGKIQERVAETFKNWGITTIKSILNAVSIKPQFEIWGSGGVRHGLDAAKLFALGATTAGFAKPMLEAALIDVEEVYKLMTTIEYELRVAMFCTGSRVLADLKGKACL
ncbi:type 2 isopentenyl-diphosphate Delta-isomerase [Legionella gresilensis]|uniref:type 2 isopentenyl-diphosphate Delta-isomerase n=1 Tax=Legionella gresilensis TaxID=91823 RepID=UPI0010411F05|nr:type 2 isopentenyl-diphosphate Delta-isomerase [Legionella gresilensis]